jgi:hypothetical protein
VLIAFMSKDKILYIDFKPTRARMLPLLHFQHYQAFQQALEQLFQTLTVADGQEAELQGRYQNVQQLFQSQIATLSAEDFAPEHAPRWQSLQTEIYKQMRLLETDMMLLQASRSSTTSQRRVLSVCDRLNTLIQYCEALFQL